MWPKVFQKINYLWRVLAAWLCFTIFGLGGVLMGYLLFPVVSFFSKTPALKARRIQYLIHFSFKLFVATMQAVGVIDFRSTNLERLANSEPSIVVSNHPCLIDYVVIVSKITRCNTIVKETLWRHPFMGKVIKSAGYIPNVQSDKLLVMIEKSMARGGHLLIFPEGTRTTPGEPFALQRGAAQLALRTQTPIRLMSINVKNIFLTKQNKWYKVSSKKMLFTLDVGELVDVGDFMQEGVPLSLAARRLTAYIKDYFIKQTEPNNHCSS